MSKRCEKGKPCGATCIERDKDCLMGLEASISKSLKSTRGAIKEKSAEYKIAKSADPSARPSQLQARRVLNALREEQSLVKTDGIVKESGINWRAILGSDVNRVGSGDFGSFSSIPGYRLMPDKADYNKLPNVVGVKTGKIGPNEVRALDIVGKNDLGPQLIGARVSPEVKPGKGKIEGSNGAIAMTTVPGRRYNFSPADINGYPKSEMYWEAMAALHKLGIAHNDLHGGNVMIDSFGRPPKARLIDFGLAQVSSKAALAEALGSLSGTNFQFSAERGKGHGLTVRANLPYIEQLLIDKGFSNREIETIMQGGIRKKEKFFNTGAWGRLTEEEAQGLVRDLYEGVE
jgi:hypothetical protein